MVLAWVYLALACVFEVVFALSMKASRGFTVLWPSVWTVIGSIGGIGLLTLALKTLPVSIAYPIWVGVGSLGAVVIGAVLFNEPLGWLKIISLAAIALGVIGLRASA